LEQQEIQDRKDHLVHLEILAQPDQPDLQELLVQPDLPDRRGIPAYRVLLVIQDQRAQWEVPGLQARPVLQVLQALREFQVRPAQLELRVHPDLLGHKEPLELLVFLVQQDLKDLKGSEDFRETQARRVQPDHRDL